jgi:hypothetical protein
VRIDRVRRRLSGVPWPARLLVPGLALAAGSGGCSSILGIDDVKLGDFATDSGSEASLSDTGEPSEEGADSAGKSAADGEAKEGDKDGSVAVRTAEGGAEASTETDAGGGSDTGAEANAPPSDAAGRDASSSQEPDASPHDAGCATGATRCQGAAQETCGSDGTWSSGTVTSGQCGAQCTPGSTPACNGAAPQTCSASGVLTTGAVTSGQCGAQCTPGSTPACNGAVPQTCSTSGVLTTGAVTSGQCGAQCTPGQFQCGTSEIGQVCGTLGTWISNGSSDLCTCYVPGRFTAVPTNLALDSTTGLSWDRTMRAADTWTNASNICNNAGLRLPTLAEWQAVALLSSTEGTGMCSTNPAPFDQAAMPTSASELGCSGSLCDDWTGTPEPGFTGYVYVMQFFAPSSPGNWSVGSSDDATTGISHPYRCVK